MARFKEETGAVLLGGASLDPQDLDHLLGFGLSLFCADSGVVHLDVHRHKPKAIIGDFDSVSPLICSAFGAEDVLIDEQDTTDFEKALGEIDAPFILCLGFLGGRLDHELAAFNALVKWREKNAIIVGEDSVAFACPDLFEMDLPKGSDIGLFPMSQTRGESKGLVWPIDGVKLSPSGQISTSNRVKSSPVEVNVQAGKMIVILPREQLGAILKEVFGYG